MAAAPNCLFKRRRTAWPRGCPRLPDLLPRLPLTLRQALHPATSAHPSAPPSRVSRCATLTPSSPLRVPFCPPDRQVAGCSRQDPAPRDSKDPGQPAPPRSGRAGLQGLRQVDSVLSCGFHPAAALILPRPSPILFLPLECDMFVPCGESVPDLAGFTLLMVSPCFHQLSPADLGLRPLQRTRGVSFTRSGTERVLVSISGSQPSLKTQGGCRWRQQSRQNPFLIAITKCICP